MASGSRVAPLSFATQRDGSPPAANGAARPARLGAWRVGQLLAAVVIERAGAGQVWLNVDGAAIRAWAPADLPAGAELRLRVKTLGA